MAESRKKSEEAKDEDKMCSPSKKQSSSLFLEWNYSDFDEGVPTPTEKESRAVPMPDEVNKYKLKVHDNNLSII